MIINYDSPGQLCNRIWSLVPSIAYGLEYNKKVFIINFWQYSSHFENLNKNKTIYFTSNKLYTRLFKLLEKKEKLQNKIFNLFFRLFKINFIQGWPNRMDNFEMVLNQTEVIREIFRFNSKITFPIDVLFSSFEDLIIIGVHIRRGDYREWRKGIYFYDDEKYLSLMEQLELQLRNNSKKAKFLLCSNEPIDLLSFKKVDCFMIPDSSGEKDLYALSKCSYIFGPPSTYSQWASFLGNVPMKMVKSPEEKIKLSEFSVISALDRIGDKNFIFL